MTVTQLQRMPLRIEANRALAQHSEMLVGLLSKTRHFRKASADVASAVGVPGVGLLGQHRGHCEDPPMAMTGPHEPSCSHGDKLQNKLYTNGRVSQNCQN